jgi:cephalosporin hydroxylase
LVNKYIIFHQGYSNIELKKIGLQRINFAFLDGAHTYEDVFFEFDIIKKYQKEGDIIVFDDYNEKLFPGIVKAVDEISDKFGYDKKIIKSFDDRSYVIAKRVQ